VRPLRRDPAPSRLAYRLHRLWLRPLVRGAARLGLPAALLGGGLWWYAAEPARIDALRDGGAEVRRMVEARPEFTVRMMAVDGASPELTRAVRDLVAVEFPVSSFHLDLDAIRAGIASIDAVRDVRLGLRPGGVLQVDIAERVPALIWRRADGLVLVDATGHPIARTPARTDWPELPLIAGDGAAQAAGEALALVAAAAPLQDRLRGLVRQGARRWDLVLTRDRRILLPAAEPVAALERLLALDEARDVLGRDIVAVDLRLPQRPTLRLGPGALARLRGAAPESPPGSDPTSPTPAGAPLP